MPSRIRHVETENERVRATVAALRENDRGRLGQLFHEGHESLRVDLEVTIPQLDRLVALAVENGAVAARMTGGGFGGSIVALVDQGEAAPFAQAMSAHGRTWICRASEGAREL
jgi:galactokinase